MNSRMSAFILIALFTLLTILLLLIRQTAYWTLFQDSVQLREWLNQWGVWSPLAIVVLQIAQVLLAPIPGQVVGIASGYLFGLAWGTFYSMLGTALGALATFVLTRLCGRPLVERLVPIQTLKRLDDGARQRGLFFFVLVFLLPFLPDDLACFVAGLSPIPIPALMLAVLAGRLPGVLVSCWLGANATGLSATQWAMLMVVSALLAGLFLIYEDQLQDWAWQMTGKK